MLDFGESESHGGLGTGSNAFHDRALATFPSIYSVCSFYKLGNTLPINNIFGCVEPDTTDTLVGTQSPLPVCVVKYY